MKMLLLLLLFVTGTINAQIVNIPDVNFKTKLLEADISNTIAKDSSGNFFKIDANSDGEIQESEAITVLYINVKGEALDLFNTNISSLTGIEAFSNLETLDCSYNNLNNLDITQNVNLKVLICGPSNDFYALTSLNVTPLVDLQILDCSGHELANLDVTQNTEIKELRFSQNLLTTIDLTNNINLETLFCFSNNLSSIDLSNNVNLKTFECSANDLTNLDVTQNIDLETLRFGSNELISIDVTQNVNLQDLYLSNNSVTSIDVSQNVNLQKLDVKFNELTSIDVTQNVNLQDLDCQHNQLSSIDVSYNGKLQSLDCYNNQLTTLFIKNGSDEAIMLESPIPVPNNDNIQYICADEFQIDTIKALVGINTEVNSYCSVIPGGDYNTISGSILFDADMSGCDASDLPFPNIKLNINQDLRFSNANGDYFYYTDVGNFDITPDIENPSWFTVSPVTSNVTFTDNDNAISTQNFCIVPNGVHQDVDVIIAPIVAAQPGFDAVYNIVYRNKGNQVVSGDIELVYDDTVLDYIASSVGITSQTTGSLLWNYTGLNPFESRSITVTLNVNSPMETPAVNIDDILVFESTINPVASDETSVDNVFSIKQVVIGSYDPNDITCLEGDTVSPDTIGDDLHYNINFENTGTAAATFVVIKDVIDEVDYNISSIQVMYASHTMQTRVVDNTIEFLFDNINLGPNEKGNVIFKIKTKNSLGVGDSVANEAEIFFDYNFPIETNIATTSFQVLSTDEFEINNTISVFPNPTNEIINIKSNSIMTSIKICDALGRPIYSKKVEDISTKIDCSNYMDGIYYVIINTEFGQSVKQMIKN